MSYDLVGIEYILLLTSIFRSILQLNTVKYITTTGGGERAFSQWLSVVEKEKASLNQWVSIIERKPSLNCWCNQSNDFISLLLTKTAVLIRGGGARDAVRLPREFHASCTDVCKHCLFAFQSWVHSVQSVFFFSWISGKKCVQDKIFGIFYVDIPENLQICTDFSLISMK